MRAGRPSLLLAAWLPNLPRTLLNYSSQAGAIGKPRKMASDSLAGLSAAEIIRLLDLHPHPEGGFFRETFRDSARDARGRAVSTLIYFLLDAGQVSRWHKVDATEVWHFYAGAPLEIWISQNGSETGVHRLGP